MLVILSVVLLAVLAAGLLAMRLAVASLLLVGLVAARAGLGGDRMWGHALAGGFAFKSADKNVEAIGHRSVLPPPGESGVKFADVGFVPHCGKGMAISFMPTSRFATGRQPCETDLVLSQFRTEGYGEVAEPNRSSWNCSE
ncbi:hypothetical protein [Mesorhizobium sp. RIZ17]|uniref:hypothetical protein n=1 Tax=Mesorhizobium sp. RIZ17 TaxID=3132743 RepID=UPI003DA9756D